MHIGLALPTRAHWGVISAHTRGQCTHLHKSEKDNCDASSAHERSQWKGLIHWSPVLTRQLDLSACDSKEWRTSLLWLGTESTSRTEGSISSRIQCPRKVLYITFSLYYQKYSKLRLGRGKDVTQQLLYGELLNDWVCVLYVVLSL